MNEKGNEEYLKLMHFGKLIIGNKVDKLIEAFGGSVSQLISYKSDIGTIAHICVYMRNIHVLRKIIFKFDDIALLKEWLDERDDNGKTAMDLVSKHEFNEMYLYLSKVISEHDIVDKKQEFVLKEGELEKYTNIVNGYKTRRIVLTLDSLYYFNENGEKSKITKLCELSFQYTKKEARIKLKCRKSELAFDFRGSDVEDVNDWACLIQNLIEANNNRTFYHKNYIFKLIFNAVKRRVENIEYLMLKSDLYPYYIRETNIYPNSHITCSNDLIYEVKGMIGDSKKNEECLDSDGEYIFYEARDE